MNVFEKIADVRAFRWKEATKSWLTWGLVPTMGALHEGHLALIQRARAENDRVGVSIFVNPKQFNRADDLNSYPRPLEHDLELLAKEKVDVVWTPSIDEVYPKDFQTSVSLGKITLPLEGAARPGHFTGVATVVSKLFNVFQPHRAYFGQKDAQQVSVIRQLVKDLAFNVEVIACPTVRESDGLAMSSRNLLLTPLERQAAPILYRALTEALSHWKENQSEAEHLRELIEHILQEEPLTRIDYVSIANPITLHELEGKFSQALVSMAVYIGSIRLIDNILLE
jgi:pantoate--beta-alanine ligase